MKILHVCLAAFYIDNFTYQENLLPKHHSLQGHRVKILASLQNFNKDGSSTYLKESKEYINENLDNLVKDTDLSKFIL